MSDSRIESLLEALLNGTDPPQEPVSRVEAYLYALISGTNPPSEPQSRIEAYLAALCERGIAGGGEARTNTYLLRDESGNEYPAVLVDEQVMLTATANDIRDGCIAVTDDGITEGEKIIPVYHTAEGYRLIPKGSAVVIPNINEYIDGYDYTKIQTMICRYDANPKNSVYTEKVSVDDAVYEVLSTEPISTIMKNHDTKNIELGIVNDSEHHWLIRFFTYKEVE